MTSLTEQEQVREANKHRTAKIQLEAQFLIILRVLLAKIAKELAVQYQNNKTLSAFQFQNDFHTALLNQYNKVNKTITTDFILANTPNAKEINKQASLSFNNVALTVVSQRLLYIINTTQKDIHTTISRFVDFKQPENFNLLQHLFKDSTSFRAQLIAVTETQNAVELKKSQISEQFVQHDNHTLTKTWVTILDDKERPAHTSAFGQTVSHNTVFTVMDEYLMFPGDISHGATPSNICNCRCSAIYEAGSITTPLATHLRL